MKILPTVIIAALAGLIVFFVQESRINDLRKQLTQQEAVLKTSSSKYRSTASSTTQAISTPLASGQKRTITEDKPATTEEDKKDPIRSMAKIFETDAGREMLKQGIKAGLPMMYGDFIESLNLNPEEKKYFESLLAERMLNQQQLGMKWMQADAEKRIEIGLEMEKVSKSDVAKIEEFLQSEEDSIAFKTYEKQLPERQQMKGIRSALSDEPLSAEKEEQLIDTLYQARLNSGEGNASDEENWQSLAETGNFEAIQERWDQTDALIEKEIPSVLSSEQTEAFLEHWETARAFQKTQYQMGMQMLGIEQN